MSVDAGALRADLRKALLVARAEIRALDISLRRAGDALFAQHNHWRAMKGLPPHEKRLSPRRSRGHVRRRETLRKLEGIYLRAKP